MAYENSPTRVLTEYPLNYPQHLVAETEVIIAKAVKKFPTLDLILPLIEYVVARMTPVMMRETSAVRADLVRWRMEALVDSILIHHFLHDPKKCSDLKQVILNSDKWQAMAKAVAKKCAAPMPEKPEDRTSVPAAAAHGSIRQIIQVNNRAAVYVAPPKAKQAKKRKRKPTPPRVQEPAPASPAEPALDKTATEPEAVTGRADLGEPSHEPAAGRIDQPSADEIATEPEPEIEATQPPLAAVEKAPSTSIAGPQPVAAVEELSFSYSDDYLNITYCGKVSTQTPKQRKLIGILHAAYQRGQPVVHKETLLQAIDSTTEVRNYFRHSPLWGTLVIKGPRKGTFQLNLPAPPASKARSSR